MTARKPSARQLAMAHAALWEQDRTEHPAYVPRSSLRRPLKKSGWCRIKAEGARLAAHTAVLALQVAGAPHTYRDANCFDPLVPRWVAVVFSAYVGHRGEVLAERLKAVMAQGDEFKAALMALADNADREVAREFLRARIGR